MIILFCYTFIEKEKENRSFLQIIYIKKFNEMKSFNNDEYLHISYKIFLIVLVLCQIDEEIVPHLILEMTN